MVTGNAYNANTSPIFLEQRILPLNKIIKQSKLLFMHSINMNYCPESFLNIWVKNNTRLNDYALSNNRAGHIAL